MADNLIKIHDVVQDRYSSIAAAGGEACCGDKDLDSRGLYDAESLADLPVDVTGLSLGCGDPVSIAGLQQGEWVLDLGSGGGIDCFLAARQVGETGYVIGVDMTLEMLARANENKVKLGATNVEFRRGQIEQLPVVDNSIDLIMSNCVINLSPDKEAVFAEVFRVLKPGGRIAISDIVTDGDFSPEMLADTDQWAECVTGAIEADAYLGMIREAGFEQIELVDKVNAESIVPRKDGMPRVFSARITARKPESA